MNSVVVAALYKFASLPDYCSLREPLLQYCLDAGIYGTLLLAAEGINGTVAGSREAIDGLLSRLRADPRLADLSHKESYHSELPFYRMKVKLKREIVTMGVADIDPRHVVGTYVEPVDWNRLISDPEVVLVDTRNDYEVELGTFRGAINPKTRSFSEFPEYVAQNFDPARQRKVAMFCTGGIRCEKSTAYMKELGFDEVYHLKGGILQYLEDIPVESSLWQGECFVFDKRVSVDHRLKPGQYDLCHGCREPISEADKAADKYVAGVSCPRCYDRQSEEQRARFQERQKQMELSRLRNQPHIGAPPPKRQRRVQPQRSRAVEETAKSSKSP